MLFRTHIAVCIFFFLIFFEHLENSFLFFIIMIIATAIPDIDSRFSKIGRHKIFRIFNFFFKHRGIMHSFTFLAAISIILFLFSEEIALPFVFGYSLHLILDCFTLAGIKLFYPFKLRIRGILRTGGITELVLFIVFFSADLFLVLLKCFK